MQNLDNFLNDLKVYTNILSFKMSIIYYEFMENNKKVFETYLNA